MANGHHVEVVAATDLTPGLRRITVGGPALRNWASTGRPDEYVPVQVPPADPESHDGVSGGAAPEAAQPDDARHDDQPGWEVDPAAARFYTVRRWEPGTDALTLDIVVHDGGRGSEWARRCRPGSQVVVGAPKGYWDPPPGSTARLLVADATGLPAVARILEEASPQESFHVVVEVADPRDMLDLASPARVSVDWRVSGNGRTPSTLPEALAGRPTPPPATYVWVACETSVSRRIRLWLRAAPQQRDTDWYRIVGYWHADKERVMARWAALTPAEAARARDLWDQDRPDEVNWLDYEAFLQDVGL